MALTGGQALARQLVAEGVSDVFGIPGVQLDWATDALLDVADALRYVVPRHEQAASYMADGYARSTGRVGVCMVVPGPGLLNAMAGLATAYACNSRVLCITGQIPSGFIGRDQGMLHEVRDQSRTLGTVTKWQALATQPQQVPGLVHEAFVQLRSGPPRPVGLELPPDVLSASAGMVWPDTSPGPSAPGIDDAQLDRLANQLRRARWPVIYAGGGAVAARVGAALAGLAERLQAPVVMSDNGRGALSARHPLAASALGGRCLLPHADFVLVLGSRFVDVQGRATHTAAGCELAYVNLNPAHVSAPRHPGTVVCADVGAVVQALVARLQGHRASGQRQAAVAKVRDWCESQIALIQPQQQYVQALRRAIPEDGVLVSELTQVGYLANIAYPVYSPGTYLTPGYQGTLGFGFATAVGAALADPGRVVVSLNGDGGFGWNLQELATVARYRPRLAIVVFEDGAFGNVRRIQARVFKREIGTTLCNPDFLALARAFGLPAVAVDSPADLESALRAAFDNGGPVFVLVRVGAMPGPWHLIHTFSPPPKPAPPNPLDEPVTT
jgi:acetolactate synthase-1/2/3 large subunit